MEGLIIFIFVAVVVLGINAIKWVFSQDITSQDIRNDREKRWEEHSLGLRKPFNREEAEEAAREYHKKKGQFKDITDKPKVGDYIRGERGGLYEIRISSRTGKPYRHYF